MQSLKIEKNVHKILKEHTYPSLMWKRQNERCSNASVKVWLLWEGAPDPSDDDIGGVVSGPDTLLQLLLLDQCREESWVDRRAEANL